MRRQHKIVEEVAYCDICGIELNSSNTGDFYFTANCKDETYDHEVCYEYSPKADYCTECMSKFREWFQQSLHELIVDRYDKTDAEFIQKEIKTIKDYIE